MKLEKFIKQLKIIAKKYGENIEVVMADSIPVVDPIFFNRYPHKKAVVITDIDYRQDE